MICFTGLFGPSPMLRACKNEWMISCRNQNTPRAFGLEPGRAKNEKTPLVDRALNLLLKKKQEKERSQKPKGTFFCTFVTVKHLLPF